MGYWMHVYSCDDEPMSFESIEEFFEGEDDVVVELCSGGRGVAWKQLCLERDGDAVALIEVFTGGDIPARINERVTDILTTRPRCNADYVAALLRGVKAIYQFQILGGGGIDDAVRALQDTLIYGSDAVLWAEGEGYSCDMGHLTWEFPVGVSGGWSVALYVTGEWDPFRIELGDRAHREAFLDGRRPEGT